MDKIEKNLKKLSLKERKQLERVVERLIKLNWIGLDIIKLKGSTNLFRARSGRMRIIFKYMNNQVDILEIERRSEKTYRNF